ncbi:MAG: hypothetical protein DMG13_26720, partial [Acidobacteria bacterium]
TNDHAANGPNSAGGTALGVEGILEYRVLTHNFSAEYGRNSGGVISMVTRSGTNSFHGSAYEFLRNKVFDARNFFNQGELPPFTRNQFGAAFGGPIKKDRMFFFLNYEGLRQRQGRTFVSTVPDDNARNGLVPCTAAPTAACNTSTNLASPPLNPASLPYLRLYPVANASPCLQMKITEWAAATTAFPTKIISTCGTSFPPELRRSRVPAPLPRISKGAATTSFL